MQCSHRASTPNFPFQPFHPSLPWLPGLETGPTDALRKGVCVTGNEMLGPTLLSLHNLAFYLRLMREARGAIRDGGFAAFRAACLARWNAVS